VDLPCKAIIGIWSQRAVPRKTLVCVVDQQRILQFRRRYAPANFIDHHFVTYEKDIAMPRRTHFPDCVPVNPRIVDVFRSYVNNTIHLPNTEFLPVSIGRRSEGECGCKRCNQKCLPRIHIHSLLFPLPANKFKSTIPYCPCMLNRTRSATLSTLNFDIPRYCLPLRRQWEAATEPTARPLRSAARGPSQPPERRGPS
jgi:hypothetical protein